MKLNPEYEKRLADIGGRLPDGTPKLRIVTPEEAIRPHGGLKGKPKYFDPTTGKPFSWLTLECWLPPTMIGSREDWRYDLFGVYPADCELDCCNRGIWGLKAPLTIDGSFIPVGEFLMQFIEGRQFMDVKWSLMDEVSRLEWLNEQQAAAEKRAAAETWELHNIVNDEYASKKEKEDAADTRVTIGMGKSAIPDHVKGGKKAIGNPVLWLPSHLLKK